MKDGRPKLVFAGPTLHGTGDLMSRGVILLPPAVQGSVIFAVQHFDPAAIAIIDGGFQSEPAVRHKEILWALARGVPVIGAASIGALRAAELFPHMQGVGLIYRWYRRFPFAADDAVAVLHGPAETDYLPLTHALIDLRMTIRRAFRGGRIGQALATNLDRAARTLNFRDRTVANLANAADLSDEDRARCRAVLVNLMVEQKKRDALEAIDRLVVGLPPPSAPAFRMTATFRQDLQHAGLET